MKCKISPNRNVPAKGTSFVLYNYNSLKRSCNVNTIYILKFIKLNSSFMFHVIF